MGKRLGASKVNLPNPVADITILFDNLVNSITFPITDTDWKVDFTIIKEVTQRVINKKPKF